VKVADNVHLIAPSWSYVYLIVGEKLAFIDTGLPQYFEDVRKYVEDLGHRLQDISFIINTHVHEDHVGCNKALKDICKAKLAIHELDAKYIENPVDFLKDTFRHMPPSEDYVREAKSWKDNVDIFLKDGDIIELGGVTLEVVHTYLVIRKVPFAYMMKKERFFFLEMLYKVLQLMWRSLAQ